MRTGRKRNQRVTLPTVHDRLSNDLVRNADVVPVEIDDPYEYGGKILAFRSLRDDPIGRLFCRGQIDQAQFDGGNAYREDWEKAERGPKAIDPSKEFVDGGALPEPITEGQRKATIRLNRANRELGASGSALIIDVLVHGRTMEQVAERRGLSGQRWLDYFGKRFREALDTLALVYGFAMRSENRTKS